MSAITDTKKVSRDRFCVTTTEACRPNVPTFGCRGDMLPTCRQLFQPSILAMMWWWCGGSATSYPDEMLGSTPQTWLNGLAFSHVSRLTLSGAPKILLYCTEYRWPTTHKCRQRCVDGTEGRACGNDDTDCSPDLPKVRDGWQKRNTNPVCEITEGSVRIYESELIILQETTKRVRTVWIQGEPVQSVHCEHDYFKQRANDCDLARWQFNGYMHGGFWADKVFMLLGQDIWTKVKHGHGE